MSRPTPQEKLAILQRRRHVARRYLRGESQWEIATSFELDQCTISRDLEALRKEWRAAMNLDTAALRGQELAKIDETERQAWQGWEKSRDHAEILRAKMRGSQQETEKVTRGQCGDPRFLEVILKCVEKRCLLLGLMPVNQTPENGTPVEVRLIRSADFYHNADRLQKLAEQPTER
jgi:hypothetical protein